MRQIVLDTETTGLYARNGDRIVEIGCVELVCRKPTGRRLHRYINPEREVPVEAQRIHGLTDEFLADKPKFSDVAAELADFIREAELVIHNASFDMEFLNNEFGLLGNAEMESAERICASVIDTLKMARDMRPGKRNSLDALCGEYGIDNSNRQFHGALLDAELLAEVYLAMTRGQESLVMDLEAPTPETGGFSLADRPPLRIVRASEAELTEHERVLAEIGKESKGKCLWLAETATETATGN
jgi:DNA polymerase III subunit epsilon